MAKHIHIHGKFVAPIARAVRDAATRDDFKETDHPRAPDGRFGNKAGQHEPTSKHGLYKTDELPDRGRVLIRNEAEKLQNLLQDNGFKVEIEHSGSAAGPSSYLRVSDPVSGFFLTKQLRLSGHSKGVFGNEGVLNVAGEESFQETLNKLKEIRAERLKNKAPEKKEVPDEKAERKEKEDRARALIKSGAELTGKDKRLADWLRYEVKMGRAQMERPANTAYEAAPSLSKEDRAIEDRLGQKVTQHYDEAVREYDKLPDAGGGKVLNTDTARELSPDYMKDRTKSAAVHEPASYFIKKLYAQKLASMPEDGRVVFTSGGTGAGKTTAVQNVAAMKHLTEGAHIVYDTNMNTEASAVKKIDQALAAGAGHVHIVHVQRDPVEALVLGALKRAASQAAKFGTGRTVPLKEHLKTHVGAAKTVQALAEKYKDDPRVHIDIIDNTKGKGKASLAGMDFIKNFDYTDVERKLSHALETEYQAGRVPEAVYRATKGT